jgi:DNA-directed RNA polymerase subunit K/omega
MNSVTLDGPVSVEECLGVIPNRFKLAMIVMSRARDILLGAKCDVLVSKFAKKSVNRVLGEIKSGQFDVAASMEKIKRDIATNNLFQKNVKSFADEDFAESDEFAMSELNLKNDDDASVAELDSEIIQDVDSESEEEMADDPLEMDDL